MAVSLFNFDEVAISTAKNIYLCADCSHPCGGDGFFGTMTAYVFPGQGAQTPGMGLSLYESSEKAKTLFESANDILGFRITDIMFGQDAERLLATDVTQPAVFIHSVTAALTYEGEAPSMVAGHSLGEFSALVANGTITFEDGLRLVSARAAAMQRCCEKVKGVMAAAVGGDAATAVRICGQTEGIVIAANFNSDNQIVISGEAAAVERASAALKTQGFRRVLPLKVSGAFHSPLMEPARTELAKVIESTPFTQPRCPVYQNVDARPHTDPSEIKNNLLCQLTSPVLWTDTMRNMVADGADSFVEMGPGTVLKGLGKKIAPEITFGSFC